MRIFLTGGTGAIGTRVVPLLLAAGHDVTGTARSRRSADALGAAGARALAVDLFDAGAVRRAVAGHDAVVHLATAVPHGAAALRAAAWEPTARLRRDASRVLVDAALAGGAGRYVHESLAFAYADGGSAWLDEGAPLAPHPLQAAMRDAERQARRITDGGGAGVTLRFGTFYGAGSAHTEQELALAHRGWAARVGRPDAFTPVVHLDDAAAAVAAALAVPAGTYHVVDDEPLTRRAHAAALAAAFGLDPLRLPPAVLGRIGPLRGIGRSHRVSNARLRSVSAWRPRHPSAREGWAQVARAAAHAPGGRRAPAGGGVHA